MKGRKPGTPKTGGRQAGTPNKATPVRKAQLEALAIAHAEDAIAILAEIAQNSTSDAARVSAAIALLDRAYGKPRQAIEHSGTDGDPIQIGLVKCVIVDPKERRDMSLPH